MHLPSRGGVVPKLPYPEGRKMSQYAGWTKRQLRLIEWEATDRHERFPPTQAMLAKELGITARAIQRWKKKDGFWDAVNELAEAYLSQDLPQVMAALRREACKGSLGHIRTILELTGRLRDEPASNTLQVIFERDTASLPEHLAPSTNGRANGTAQV